MPRNLFGHRLAPRAQLGDPVLLLGQSAFRAEGGTSLYEVTGIEALTAVGQHAALLVWTQAGTPPAGYALDPNAAVGSISPGAGMSTAPLQSLKNAQDEVSQIRFVSKVIGAPPAGWSTHDLDLMVSQPGSSKRWGTFNAPGVLNAMNQVSLPGDVVALPTQGNNMTNPDVQNAVMPFDAAFRTELFIHRDESPSFTVQNNGAVAMNAPAQAVAIMVAGFKYKLNPLRSAATQQVDKQMLGLPVRVPSWLTDEALRWDVPILPVASRF